MEQEKELVLGIDDAGRGPVIGPMCLAGCILTRALETELKSMGVMDSKLLTAKKRQTLSEIIKKKAIAWHAELITPVEIDTGMGEGLNLNQVEAMAAAAIIKELLKKITAKERASIGIIIDCPSNNKNGWLNQLAPYLEARHLNIRCEHKADRDFVVVSAASIIAKTTRDAEIEKLKKQIGIDFGSGYPADPVTKDFLKKHVGDFKKERIFRESWETWKEARNRALGVKETSTKQKRLFE